jgi:hypothetical protein
VHLKLLLLFLGFDWWGIAVVDVTASQRYLNND